MQEEMRNNDKFMIAAETKTPEGAFCRMEARKVDLPTGQAASGCKVPPALCQEPSEFNSL